VTPKLPSRIIARPAVANKKKMLNPINPMRSALAWELLGPVESFISELVLKLVTETGPVHAAAMPLTPSMRVASVAVIDGEARNFDCKLLASALSRLAMRALTRTEPGINCSFIELSGIKRPACSASVLRTQALKACNTDGSSISFE